jgi:hypothetical protein
MQNSETSSKRKHYTTKTIAGVVYDKRTLLNEAGQELKIQHYENVSVKAFPMKDIENKITNKTRVMITIPFGWEPKTIFLIVNSPRKVDVINACIKALNNVPTYRKPCEIRKREKALLMQSAHIKPVVTIKKPARKSVPVSTQVQASA